MGHPRSKRRILARPRRATFTPEVVALFAELENTPRRARCSGAFRTKDQELAKRLGLEIEHLCDCRSVLDRDKPPTPTFARPVHEGQWRVYRVRRQLLEAIRSGTEKAAPVLDDRRVEL
jgi:hypothetical protein